MINNDSQLTTVREQIERLKIALAWLERDVRPKSEQQFQVLSEGYVDQIAELDALVDAYVREPGKQDAPLGTAVVSK